MKEGNQNKTVDGLIDLIYVCIGGLVDYGFDGPLYWDEVHKTNMAKVGGPVRQDGKILKPEGWIPPDIDSLLASQRKIFDKYINVYCGGTPKTGPNGENLT